MRKFGFNRGCLDLFVYKNVTSLAFVLCRVELILIKGGVSNFIYLSLQSSVMRLFQILTFLYRLGGTDWLYVCLKDTSAIKPPKLFKLICS